MIQIELGTEEVYDYDNDVFIQPQPRLVTFNHCLASISKWESKYKVPFLEQKELTNDQSIYYFACMAEEPIRLVDLTNDVVEELNNYVRSNATATTFRDDPKAPVGKKTIMTAEVMYGYMVVGQIPWEAQYWHITKLQALIRVVNDLQTPDKDKKKMSRNEVMKQNTDLNAQRRAMMNSKG